MAFNALQQNTITNLQGAAQRLLQLKTLVETTHQQYNNELYPAIIGDAQQFDADLAAIPDFAHLTNGEIVNANAAFEALLAEFGDFETGHWGALLKLLGSGVE